MEARADGEWIRLGRVENNRTRLIKLPFDRLQTTALRIRLLETYGCANAKLFEIRCYDDAIDDLIEIGEE